MDTWNQVLELDIVDQYELKIECYDHDLLAEDALVGQCVVSLLPVFKKGELDTWVALKAPSAFGNPIPAG